ncbi:MAG: hypothetical protein OEU92_06390 [Alphaproteobacteria bacterium]|nr:hypothetical protein [Alphaproteobacteria bacterium]
MASTVEMKPRSVREEDGARSVAGLALIVLGVALVVIGALMMVYLGMTVFGILKTPADTELVTLILEKSQEQGQAFFGTFGQSRVEFTLGEPLRTLLFVLLLLWILGALLNIIKAIIAAGRDLVTAGRQQ